jgi:signal peptidase I
MDSPPHEHAQRFDAPAEQPIAGREAQRDRPSVRSRIGALVFEVIQTILLTLLIFFAVRTVVQNFRVEGASMVPTLESGQYLLINKIAYARTDTLPISSLLPPRLREKGYVFGGPQRGDIIVFHSPTLDHKEFIKRVIALPGDQVRIARGKVQVNGQLLDEPFILHQAGYDFPLNGRPFTVPVGQYFVLGDNRPNSSDSHLGWTVPAQDIIGKAWISYWPPSEWKVIPDQAYAIVR